MSKSFVRTTAFVIFLSALGLMADEITESPLATGLPQTLPLDIFDQPEFITYDDRLDHGEPPLGTLRWEWANSPMNSLASLADPKRTDLLYDKHFASIPEKSTIGEIQDVAGRRVWRYPEGTTLLHVFFFKTNEWVDPVFELRMLRKLPRVKGDPDAKWAFGVYVVDGASKRFRLLNFNSPERTIPPTDIATPAGLIRISGERIHTESCRGCHLNHSPANYQYFLPHIPFEKREDYAGPCGFVPLNEGTIKSEWACGFLKRSGTWPFPTKNLDRLRQFCHLSI